MDWRATLVHALSRSEGVRFGEAAVVSRRLHLVTPALPEEVTVLCHQDAGQVFYGRRTADEVVHLDVFHQVGDVDHHQVAAALRTVLADEEHSELADFFDVQTATGGGRLTGDLRGGQRPSLRAAHQNHVHVAGLLPEGDLAIMQPIVAAVESAIMGQGLEIRQVALLRHQRQAGTEPLDLRPYSDYMDSFLRGGEEPPSGTGGGAGAASASGADMEGRDRAAAAAIHDEARVQHVLSLAQRVGSPEELQRILDSARAGPNGFTAAALASPALRELENAGLVRRDICGLRLTEAGQALARYLEAHLRDLTLRFRKQLRHTPRPVAPAGPGSSVRPSAAIRSGPIRGTEPAGEGKWLGSIALPETVLAAVTHSHLDRAARPRSEPTRPWSLHLTRNDIHVYRRVADPTLNICLLIDASASMAGKRMLAAKHLVRHLLASTRDRVAVVGFQERQVRVHVPFTRNFAAVESGLAELQPLGLTPLAHGLTTGADLIKAARVRRPLLLLITDGIPTVPQWTQDPLADALQAASRLARGRIPFGCIGLMPARRYLEELARNAGGRLHVVEELDAEALVAIVHQERQRHL